jgi:ribosomal protein S27AE
MSLDNHARMISKIKRLVLAECCNYEESNGKCLLLRDTKCPQVHSSPLCRFFKEAVMPLDKELMAEFGTAFKKSCKRCGKDFPAEHHNQGYCPSCKTVQRKESNRIAKRKQREKSAKCLI